MASPRAVPPSACSASSAAWISARSVVGATRTCAVVPNVDEPDPERRRQLVDEVEAACCALSSRVGATSVAIIEPDTSIARMIVASSRGTASTADGRASARTSAAIATTYSAGGTWRRQAGASRDEVGEQVDVREPDDVAAAPPLDEQVDRDQHRHREEPDEERGFGEGHEALPRVRSWPARSRSQSSDGGQDDVPGASAPELGRQRTALGGGRGREPLAERSRGGVDTDLAAGLGIDERQLADVGQVALARVVDLDREDVVACRDGRERRSQSRGPRKSETRTTSPPRRAAAVMKPKGRGRRGRRRCQWPVGGGRAFGARQQQGRQQPVATDGRLDPPVAGPPNVTMPSRLPRWVARWPTAIATPSATSALRRSGRAERHRWRESSSEPRRQRALRDVDADVRDGGPGGDVPVDPADVVARLVGPDLGQLEAAAEVVRPVLPGEQPVDPTADRQVERAEQRLRCRARDRAVPSAEAARPR